MTDLTFDVRRDELLSQGAFYGMSRAAARTRADELIDSLDLAGFATRSVQQLSGGQKRRVDVEAHQTTRSSPTGTGTVQRLPAGGSRHT